MNDDGDHVDDNDSQKVEEEDWSDFLQSATGCDGADVLNDNGFARHDTVLEFPVLIHKNNATPRELTTTTTTTGTVKIACVKSLSPIDMVNLSWGTSDATGHRIWLGAKLFLHALSNTPSQVLVYLNDKKRILELGAGTGVVGIAVAKVLSTSATKIILTDSSTSALELCKKNCRTNLVNPETNNVEVTRLCWGDTLASIRDQDTASVFDTVIAADVLYDLKMWKPILQTASMSLSPVLGHFLLSHVPRAAIPEDDARMGDSIEDIILHQASLYGFDHICTIRPSDLSCLMKEEQEDMQEKGAAIFIWKKALQ
jgi:predicted nicotinamide N-methyase